MRQHLIQKYIFDVGFDSENKAVQFQNQLTPYVKEKLLHLTEEIFNEVSIGKNISIDKLRIDLGDIPLGNFEEEVYTLLKFRLRDKLKLLLSGIDSGNIEERILYSSPIESGLKSIEFFLLNGTLPWSVPKKDPEFSIHKLICRFILEAPIELKKIFSSLVPREDSKMRIIRQLEDEVLWMVIQIWIGTETEKIRIFYSDLSQIYFNKPLIKNHFSEYRELIWEFILAEVIISNNSYNEKAWVTGFINYTSKKTNNPIEKVVNLFHSSINEKKTKALLKFQITFPEPKAKSLKETKPDLLKETQPIHSSHDFIKDKVELEEFRQKEIRKRQNYLIDFLTVAQFGFNGNEFQTHTLQDDLRSEIEKAESIIIEFSDLNPVVIKKAFAEVNFDIKTYHSQQILLMFSKEVREIVLNDILKIGIHNFEVSRKRTYLQALIVFLETGHFPYSVLPLYFKKTDLNELFTNLYKNEKEEINRIIKKIMFSKSENNLKILEIKKQLSAKTFKLLFTDFHLVIQEKNSGVSSSKGSLSKDKISISKSIKLTDLKTQDSIINLIQFIFKEKSLPEKAVFTISEVIEKFISVYKEAALVYFASIKESELQIIQNAVLPELAKAITKRRDELFKAVKAIKKILPSSEVAQVEKKDPVYNFKEQVTDEPIYINNAGLVIFHPYLSRFFNILQLLDKKAFKDEYSAHKAVYLLQYLANKGLNNEEHELVLNKLLCGIDLRIPLIRNIVITEEDKNTCEDLIQGVIQNWSILKKTSNDNFRASFIMREGRLLFTQKDWKLKIEERGYDILVEKLPWSISMIKLAWMKNMINVEWK